MNLKTKLQDKTKKSSILLKRKKKMLTEKLKLMKIKLIIWKLLTKIMRENLRNSYLLDKVKISDRHSKYRYY